MRLTDGIGKWDGPKKFRVSLIQKNLPISQENPEAEV